MNTAQGFLTVLVILEFLSEHWKGRQTKQSRQMWFQMPQTLQTSLHKAEKLPSFSKRNNALHSTKTDVISDRRPLPHCLTPVLPVLKRGLTPNRTSRNSPSRNELIGKLS